jgi:hypothetical protein
MPIIEYFLLALLGSTASTPAPEAPVPTSLITLGEDVIVQPPGTLPAAGAFQKKPVKHSSRIWLKKNGQKSCHHRGSGRKGSHVRRDALTVKQKVTAEK